MAKINIDGTHKNFTTILVEDKDEITFKEINGEIVKLNIKSYSSGERIVYNEGLFEVIKR